MSFESPGKKSILKAAVILFGERGFFGVKTRALAKEASVSEGLIFKHFKTKELLFRRTFNEVLVTAEDNLGKILLNIHTQRKNQDTRQFALAALTQWYIALSPPEACVLQEVLMADSPLHDSANQPISRIVDVLVASLECHTRHRSRAQTRESAAILVTSLFQYKISQSGAQESKEVAIIRNKVSSWLDDVLEG